MSCNEGCPRTIRLVEFLGMVGNVPLGLGFINRKYLVWPLGDKNNKNIQRLLCSIDDYSFIGNIC